MDLGLKGKKVIMNGGAHGLGLASLKLFAAEGADVAFMSRKEDKIQAATKEIDAAGPGKVHGSVVDMADGADNYKKWVADAAEALGGCDIFVHMASSSGTGGTGDWQNGLDMDILGAGPRHRSADPASCRVRQRLDCFDVIDRRAGDFCRAASVQRAEGRADHAWISTVTSSRAAGHQSKLRQPGCDLLPRRQLGSDRRRDARAVQCDTRQNADGPVRQ